MVVRRPRSRRRVVRESTAADYDRLADKPTTTAVPSHDGERLVDFDSNEDLSTEDNKFTPEYYRQQTPPHYGG